MKLLLDTHTFLWLVEGSPKLSATAAAALADPVNELFLSVASVWELAIKTGNKKLTLSDPLDVYVAGGRRCTRSTCCQSSPPTHWGSAACPIFTVTRSTGC